MKDPSEEKSCPDPGVRHDSQQGLRLLISPIHDHRAAARPPGEGVQAQAHRSGAVATRRSHIAAAAPARKSSKQRIPRCNPAMSRTSAPKRDDTHRVVHGSAVGGVDDHSRIARDVVPEGKSCNLIGNVLHSNPGNSSGIPQDRPVFCPLGGVHHQQGPFVESDRGRRRRWYALVIVMSVYCAPASAVQRSALFVRHDSGFSAPRREVKRPI